MWSAWTPSSPAPRKKRKMHKKLGKSVRTKIGTGQTQCPHGWQNENIPGQEHSTSGHLDSVRLQYIERWLIAESALITISEVQLISNSCISCLRVRDGGAKNNSHSITENPNSEDHRREEVASIPWVSSKKLGKDFVVVFYNFVGVNLGLPQLPTYSAF